MHLGIIIVIKRIIFLFLKLLKLCFIVLVSMLILLSIYILKDAYEQKYEPRGYVSPLNKDVSTFFSNISTKHFSTGIESIIDNAKSIGNVKGVSYIRVYFDNNDIKSFETIFILENKGLFRGQMKVYNNGIAKQEYLYYKYSEKCKLSDYNNILKQCKNFERIMTDFEIDIQEVLISDTKITFYYKGNIIKEVIYE